MRQVSFLCSYIIVTLIFIGLGANKTSDVKSEVYSHCGCIAKKVRNESTGTQVRTSDVCFAPHVT